MTPTENSILIGVVVAAFGAGFTAIFAYLRTLNADIVSIKVAMSKLDTQVSPLWAKVQAQISADLHHPHPQYKEMDDLLEKLEAITITSEERARLEVLLVQRSHDMSPMISNSQRESAVIMIQVMKKVLREAEESPVDAKGKVELVQMPSADAKPQESHPPNMPEKSKEEK